MLIYKPVWLSGAIRLQWWLSEDPKIRHFREALQIMQYLGTAYNSSGLTTWTRHRDSRLNISQAWNTFGREVWYLNASLILAFKKQNWLGQNVVRVPDRLSASFSHTVAVCASWVDPACSTKRIGGMYSHIGPRCWMRHSTAQNILIVYGLKKCRCLLRIFARVERFKGLSISWLPLLYASTHNNVVISRSWLLLIQQVNRLQGTFNFLTNYTACVYQDKIFAEVLFSSVVGYAPRHCLILALALARKDLHDLWTLHVSNYLHNPLA